MSELGGASVDLTAALREAMAAYAHEAWSGWMRFMFKYCTDHHDGTVTIPAVLVERWKRQMQTPYQGLSSREQLSAQEEADKIIGVFWATAPGSPKEPADA